MGVLLRVGWLGDAPRRQGVGRGSLAGKGLRAGRRGSAQDGDPRAAALLGEAVLT